MNTIQERLKAMNKDLGWLSQKTGLTRDHLRKLVRDQVKDPRGTTAWAISQALRCEVDDIWTQYARVSPRVTATSSIRSI